MQDKFESANEKIGDNIEDILDELDLEYRQYGKKILLACPVHGGDNKEACAIYTNLDVPNWKCYTHGCHSNIGKSLVSFLKAILEKDVKSTIAWVENKFGKLESNLESKFNRTVKTLVRERVLQQTSISRTELLSRILKPAEYYLKEGFKKETLDKYDVGIGTKKIDFMYNRVIVPVFDDSYSSCVGILGRTLYEKCILCSGYHDFKKPCPVNKKYNNFSKWKNSPGFYCNSYLYNYWFAKDLIKRTGTAILVEGQADVWRCYEAGILNVLGIFGNTLTEDQQLLLESSGAQRVVTFLDPDSAGIDGSKSIKEYAQNLYNYENILYEREPADCSYEELVTLLGKYQ